MSESEEQKSNGIRWTQVLAGALASVTAALVGATMGVAGTVVGAGIASVITTVGGALYLRPLQRTTDSVRTVRAKVVGRSGGATVLVSTEHPDKESDGDTPDSVGDEAAPPAQVGDEVHVDPAAEPAPARGRRVRWPVVVVTSLAAFVLGMAIVTGIEWIRGESLSGEAGTTLGDLVVRERSANTEEPVAPTTSTSSETPPASTESRSPTSSTSPTGVPDSATSTPSTTTEPTATPPVSTTDEVPAPGGTVPPSR